MKTYKIHLIRHGLTEANEKGLYIGVTDLPLSPVGFNELLGLKEAYSYPLAESYASGTADVRFFSSPLKRSVQTLNTLYPNCDIEEAEGLKECDFGDWEGKKFSQLKNDEEFNRWASGKSTQIPGGEDAQEFSQRVMQTFQDIVNDVVTSGTTDTVICTHGGVVMMIMAAFAYPKHPLQDWGGPAGAGFSLRVTPGIWMREPVAEFIDFIPSQTKG